jgi:BirA family biotin operon repressor/biotin-[acetyl-CoA-carboxylase] ligase
VITRVVAFDEIDSTNAEARRRAEKGETGPLWLTAGVQTAGRGRRGRVWETASGNLAATYLFTTSKPPAEAAQVSFVAALVAHDLAFHCAGADPLPLARGESLPPEGEDGLGADSTFASSSPSGGSDSRQRAVGGLHRPPSITLKWPNDLLIDGRKAGGILVESGQGAAGLWVAVGIGINLAVAPEPAPDAAIVPTSFRVEGVEPPTLIDALSILDAAFQHWLTVWDTHGFSAIAAAWTHRAHGLGQICTARLPAETVIGTAEGLDPDGALRLRLDDGTVRRITAGDVFFSGAA